MKIVFLISYSSLNSCMHVDEIVKETLIVRNIGSARELENRVAELLALVGLRPDMRGLLLHRSCGG